MRQYFGTDGIRGVANSSPLEPQFITKLGLAIAKILNDEKASQGNTKNNVIIAKDTRVSGDMIIASLAAGLTSNGVNVEVAGVLPTPAVSQILSNSSIITAGIMVSASHNPFQDNGIKIFSNDGYKLSDEIEAKIERMISSDEVKDEAHSQPLSLGTVTFAGQYQELYRYMLSTHAKELRLDGLKIVVDCANGATSNFAKQLFENQGAKVIAIHNTPNGSNINDKCGATHVEAIVKKVLDEKANIGFSYDGDGDRLMAVGSDGKVYDGDHIISILAIYMQANNALTGNAVVGTIMTNMGIEKSLESKGIKLLRSSVGDRYVMEMMQKRNVILGGEQSGHIICRAQSKTGDGMLSSIMLLEALQKLDKTIEEVSSFITLYPQTLYNIRVSERIPLDRLPQTLAVIDNYTAELSGVGRLSVRYSGTENLLRIMVEGEDKHHIETIAEDIASVYNKEINL